MKRFIKNVILKSGTVIAAFAFAVVTVAANSSCYIPFYEPQEPAGLDKFKKCNR